MSVEILQQTAGTGAAACLDWVLVNEYPDNALPGEGDAEFSRHVAQLTGDRVRIRPRCDAQPALGGARDLQGLRLRTYDAISAQVSSALVQTPVPWHLPKRSLCRGGGRGHCGLDRAGGKRRSCHPRAISPPNLNTTHTRPQK